LLLLVFLRLILLVFLRLFWPLPLFVVLSVLVLTAKENPPLPRGIVCAFSNDEFDASEPPTLYNQPNDLAPSPQTPRAMPRRHSPDEHSRPGPAAATPHHHPSRPSTRLPNSLLEKDITLTFSTRLRSTLAAAGFTVLSTRDADPAVTFTTDQRAEIGNHAHPTACLILHATSSGNGIHIVTSAQAAPIDPDEPHAPIPWDSAQAASVSQSLSLANEIGLALERAKLPTILSRASLRPLDNLTCPAVAIEIAPLASDDSDKTPVVDLAYQQNIAKAIASAITSWRSHVIAASGAAK
jgi:N-acetylmuramoyl-L-alanine amidase